MQDVVQDLFDPTGRVEGPTLLTHAHIKMLQQYLDTGWIITTIASWRRFKETQIVSQISSRVQSDLDSIINARGYAWRGRGVNNGGRWSADSGQWRATVRQTQIIWHLDTPEQMFGSKEVEFGSSSSSLEQALLCAVLGDLWGVRGFVWWWSVLKLTLNDRLHLIGIWLNGFEIKFKLAGIIWTLKGCEGIKK